MNTEGLEQGGIVFFSGGLNPFKAGFGGATLSRLIDVVTGSKYSHTAVLLPQQCWSAPGQPRIFESTIWKFASGPQFNNLLPRLQEDYIAKGGHAWVRTYKPEFAPDWKAVIQTATQLDVLRQAGKLHYSVKRLFADAVDKSPVFAALPVAGLLMHLGEHDEGIVCSEAVALAEQGGGVDAKVKAAGFPWLPDVLPVAGQPIGCAPADIDKQPTWAQEIQIA